MKGWNSAEIKEFDELPKDAWALGYYRLFNKNWDGKTYSRNFQELMIRDLALFNLGGVKNKKILEIGCGEGSYLGIIAKMGGEIYGQDISAESVNKALEYFREENLKADIKVGSATRIIFNDDYFDGIIAPDIFEHITYEEKEKVIAEAYRCLKPGGVFIIKTPNLEYLKISLFIKRAFAILRFKPPFNIHIPHTRSNPDSQHCGLTTYAELEKILVNNTFHFPVITYIPLIRNKLPGCISKFLYGKKMFCEQIIITARKPLFLGFYP